VAGHGDGWRRSEVEDGPDRWAPPVSRLERERGEVSGGRLRGTKKESGYGREREWSGGLLLLRLKKKKRERLDGPKENLGFN
jgi:hypothetical protein